MTQRYRPGFRAALDDLADGLHLWRSWWLLSWQQVRSQYRRTVLGPWWISIQRAIFFAGLSLLFGVLMIVAAGQMWWRTTLREDPEEGSICADLFPRTCWVKVSGIGLVVGLLTGFFGVGGGFVIVPALTLLLGFPMRVAVGTSLLIITLIALTGVAAYTRLVPLDLRGLSFLIAGAIMGMAAGRQVSRALSPRLLTRAFAVVAWAVAVILIGHNLWKIKGGLL